MRAQRQPRPQWPAFVADERAMLENWLDWHRETLAMKCVGLPDEQLRERPVPPSSMSLLGLVRHMADVERGWFQRRIGRRDVPRLYSGEDDRFDLEQRARRLGHHPDLRLRRVRASQR
jgi:hypothetical protein